jgi:serine/threonine-protein kinase
MLTGRRAFGGTTLRQIMEQQLNGEPPSLADFPPGLATAVGRALDKDPARRFQTGREFAAALGDALPAALAARPAAAAAQPRTGLWLLIGAGVAVAVLVATLLRR